MQRRASKNRLRSADQIAAAETAIHAGMTALNQRRAPDAERIACGVLEQQPQHAGALHLVGMALLAQQRPRDALVPLEQAARLSQDPVTETYYALALREVGLKAEALEWLQRATTRSPPFARAFHELGVLYISLRRYADAEAALKRGLEAAPHFAELSVELGGVYICRADPQNAMTAFARALTYAPGHVRALHGFGTALLFERQFERAAERFRQVLTRNPNHARAHLDMAHCMLELGRFQEAVEVLRNLVRMVPQQYGKALKILVSSGRGQFWLRPSAAAAMLQFGELISSVSSTS